MIKTLKIVLPSVLALGTLFGCDESRIGTSGGNQVLVPVGARGIAMAGSERVLSSGIESVFWNPAGLARRIPTSALATNLHLFGDVGLSLFAVASPVCTLGALGLTVQPLDMGDISVTTVQDMERII